MNFINDKTTTILSTGLCAVAILTAMTFAWPQGNGDRKTMAQNGRHQVIETPVLVTGNEAAIPAYLKEQLKPVTK